MSHYIYIYILSIVFSVFGGWMVWKVQRNISGFYFLLFTLFSSLWFIIYFLFFSDIIPGQYLTFLSRGAFATGVLTVYSFLFFIYYFGRDQKKIITQNTLIVLGIFLCILLFYITTPYIIAGLEYSSLHHVYREISGSFFFLHLALHLIFLLLLFFISYKTLKNQTNLDKIRLKNILLSASILFISLIILQLILPYYFGIWILEREIIFLFTFFVVSVPIIIRRYYFSHIGYGIGKIIIGIVSLGISFAFAEVIKYFFLRLYADHLGYWSSIYDNHFFNIVWIVGVFIFVSYIFQKIFLSDENSALLALRIQTLKKQISRVTDIGQLNILLKNELHEIFKARTAKIEIYPEGSENIFFSEMQYFFQNNREEKVFINDIVFIENNKDFFQSRRDIIEIPKDTFLIFPLYSIGGIYIGNLSIGPKRFGDFYTLAEIDILREFSFFIEIHLKYLRTYISLQELSMNLDTKVDEKTIEYNNLINRQKEFISLISHEIKSPLSAAIFQSDGIIEDLKTKDYSKEALQEDIETLNSQLLRTGGLISKLFSVQYYDNHSVNLFLEKIQFVKFLEYEIELFSHIYEDITFISQIDTNIGFVEIDKIQFQQVINNFLDNAVKFVEHDNPIIAIKARRVDGGFYMTVEDNGKGLHNIAIEGIFDKYTTGGNKNIGLGMGLYLCKKIISMHGGSIEASNSKEYGGACFKIFLPTL